MALRTFRYSFFLMAALLLGACAGSKQAASTNDTENSQAVTGIDPNENREEANSTGSGLILIGPTTRVVFDKAPYSAWFHPGYQRYQPNPEVIKQLRQYLLVPGELSIVAYMGSWCEDSQREVPHFFKVLDLAGYPLNKLQIISLREDKTGPNGEEKTYNVVSVPTFLVLKDGKEMGRIVEMPLKTIEADLLQIITAAKK